MQGTSEQDTSQAETSDEDQHQVITYSRYPWVALPLVCRYECSKSRTPQQIEASHGACSAYSRTHFPPCVCCVCLSVALRQTRQGVARIGVCQLYTQTEPERDAQRRSASPRSLLAALWKLNEAQETSCYIWSVVRKLQAESLDLVQQRSQIARALGFRPPTATATPLRTESCCHGYRLVLAQRILQRLLDAQQTGSMVVQPLS
mmetsp:Transcript_19028/g.48712  ORF Transcript_19028/g.48712 Transcript_19028/m.48712 type:complete len:204 (-) Transcript_19028:679-1290(-)